MHYSYDYEDFIKEIESDLKEGLITLSSPLKIVRSDKIVYELYKPIIDYYYPDNKPKEKYEVKSAKDVLEEMKYHNKIIKI